jgi:hypothetical protein
MGYTDQMIRSIIALIMFFLVWAGFIKETILVVILDTIAAILIMTSVLDYCPLYAIFGISTKKMKGIIIKSKKAGHQSKNGRNR